MPRVHRAAIAAAAIALLSTACTGTASAPQAAQKAFIEGVTLTGVKG